MRSLGADALKEFICLRGFHFVGIFMCIDMCIETGLSREGGLFGQSMSKRGS